MYCMQMTEEMSRTAFTQARVDYAMDRARVQNRQWLYLPRMLLRRARYIREGGDPSLM